MSTLKHYMQLADGKPIAEAAMIFKGNITRTYNPDRIGPYSAAALAAEMIAYMAIVDAKGGNAEEQFDDIKQAFIKELDKIKASDVITEANKHLLESLTEAKSKWKSVGLHHFEMEAAGKKFEVKYDNQGYHALINGKVVKSMDRIYGNESKLKAALELEAADNPIDGTSVKALMSKVRSKLKIADLKGWWIDHLAPGNMLNKNKSGSFTIQLDKEIKADSKDTGKKVPAKHKFMIQAFYDPAVTKGHITCYLNQGGQIVTFGAKPFSFEPGDLDSFIAALKKAVNVSDSTLIKQLYESGYERYGRN